MRRELVFIIVASMLSSLGIGILGPFYLIYVQKISNSSFDLTLSYGIFWLSLAFLEIPFGLLSDRIGAKKLIIIGGILNSICNFAFLFAGNILGVFFLEFFNGMATAIQTPALNSYLSKIVTKNKRGKEFGIYNFSTNFTYGVASIASGLIVTVFGLSSIFVICSLFQMTSTAMISKIKSTH